MTRLIYQTTLLVFSLFLHSAFAQLSQPFLKHLSESGLRTEHLAYLNELHISEDSLHYLKAKYYLQYPDDSLFMLHFAKGKQLFMADSNAQCMATKRYFVQDEASRENWIKELQGQSCCLAVKQLLQQTLFAENIAESKLDSVPDDLRQDYKDLCKINKKSALLAGSLSAVIPGSGKWYIGKPKTFFMALLINAIHVFQTGEAARKLGWTHPFTLFNAGVFGVFYTANIYGSYKEVKQKKKELQREFIIHAAQYYLGEPLSLY